MNKASKSHSVRMNQELYTRLKDTAIRTGVTVSETLRHAYRQFDEKEAQVNKVKKILYGSKPSDMQRIRFSGNQAYVTNKMILYIHKNADSDMQSMGETVNDTIMEFMMSSMSDGTLLSKGRVESSNAPLILSFRINLYDVYCQVGSGQITILSVS